MRIGRPAGPIVTVAVVSWNTRELLLRCLASLAREVDAGRAEVWVVDNASSDGSAQAAREHAPWAQVVEAGANLGFGRAVNLVASKTRTQWLLCANADVALEEGALEALLREGLQANVGCVAPALLLPDGRTQHSVYPLPTIPFTLAFNLGLHRLSRALADRWCLEGYWDPDRAREVPWAIGACLLLRRSAFDTVGGFDERQWMYAEDLDLGWRLRLGGWSIRYQPAARVLHASGAATEQLFGPDRIERFTASTYAVLLRRRGLARVRATAAINVAGAVARLVWMSPLSVVSPRWRAAKALNSRWLTAHRQGLRRASTLLRDGR